MNNEKFWEIINKYKDLKDESEKVNNIIKDLSVLEDDDIFEFNDTYYGYLNDLYNDNLWELLTNLAGKIISDDGFQDFMGWIIAQGQEVTEDVINDYRNISKYVLSNADYDDFENEDILYVAFKAYKLKHNCDDNEFDKKYIEFLERD